MNAYRAIAGSWDHDLGETIHMRDSVEVHETDKAPIPTGILDPNGVQLFRIPATVRLGFHTR